MIQEIWIAARLLQIVDHELGRWSRVLLQGSLHCPARKRGHVYDTGADRLAPDSRVSQQPFEQPFKFARAGANHV